MESSPGYHENTAIPEAKNFLKEPNSKPHLEEKVKGCQIQKVKMNQGSLVPS